MNAIERLRAMAEKAAHTGEIETDSSDPWILSPARVHWHKMLADSIARAACSKERTPAGERPVWLVLFLRAIRGPK